MKESLEEKIQRVIKEEVDIVPYSSEWIELFLSEKNFLLKTFPELITRVEHFGSTSIPGLSAKPIIDMLIEVRSLEKAKEIIAPQLEFLGYDYFWRPSFGDDTPPFYAWFIKRDSQGKRTHHLHMVEKDFDIWERLLFRDFLIEFPQSARAYEEIKIQLSKKHHSDRIKYTQEKGEFIREITDRAKKYYQG